MSVPIYIQAGYAWRKGARIKAELDANAVWSEINPLRDEKGNVQVPAVVEAARAETSAMHAHFTWDKDAASQKWNEEEARYLLRSVVPVIVDTRTEDEYVSDQRVFVAVYETSNATEDAGTYQTRTVQRFTPPIQRDDSDEPEEDAPPALLFTPPPPVLLTEQREKALGILRRWADAYSADPYFAGVVAVIRTLG